ncbi:hypothetical protein [Clostridium akagii]|uniref:hypothetical protein n=1 Tax=Clostridium akagii TaxID=91623 RepID=UPI00047A76C7|nr:hypothetical protein [Clostridium akagii]
MKDRPDHVLWLLFFINKAKQTNNEVAAKMIQKVVESDIFRIVEAKPYPEDYTETTNVAQREVKDNAIPELSSHV